MFMFTANYVHVYRKFCSCLPQEKCFVLSTGKSGPLARASKGAWKDRNRKESDTDSDSEDNDAIKERLAKKQRKQVEKQRQQDELNKKQRDDELK